MQGTFYFVAFVSQEGSSGAVGIARRGNGRQSPFWERAARAPNVRICTAALLASFDKNSRTARAVENLSGTIRGRLSTASESFKSGQQLGAAKHEVFGGREKAFVPRGEREVLITILAEPPHTKTAWVSCGHHTYGARCYDMSTAGHKPSPWISTIFEFGSSLSTASAMRPCHVISPPSERPSTLPRVVPGLGGSGGSLILNLNIQSSDRYTSLWIDYLAINVPLLAPMRPTNLTGYWLFEVERDSSGVVNELRTRRHRRRRLPSDTSDG
ncbi:hypothetical protein EVAR_20794_1 [Eumeta japonica]|uniref:Uncharacterized protein n=1 Tax=Eumeta variegata TaxID=151549 RepID=A0A4C1UEB1_EUMVA|nr:hypothetical protein EVAR_20794_1 [Eumeta japonica]